ncbi:MAG: hypothetical protein JZU65_06250 [Chlorobium sp.]|nr:hypothetical protein [Chlorobium sp.]
MQQKEQIKIKQVQEKEQTRARLRPGDYQIISNMIKGRYTPGTIRKMFQPTGKGARTMKPIVIEAAKKLIKTVDNLQKSHLNN